MRWNGDTMESANINIKFSEITGKIKPMHAVNNGPNCTVGSFNGTWADHVRDQAQLRRNGNLLEYREAGIPYARTHDSSFFAKYGLEHTVDVHAIFPNLTQIPMIRHPTISTAPITIWI